MFNGNNASGTKQSEPSSQWRRFLGGLFGRRWVFRLPDKTKGIIRDTYRRPDAYGDDLL